MAGHFEARKIAWRQTKDGLVVAFVIHPDETIPSELALAALGTRYMIAFSEIGDDEKPVQKPTALQAGAACGPSTPSKDRKWEDLPLSTQAAIRCGEPAFQAFLGCASEEDCAERVRIECGVSSRAQLSSSFARGEDWRRVEARYQTYLTDRQYAGARTR